MPEIKKYNLNERIFSFVLSVINLTKKLPRDTANIIIIQQVIRCATSIGANYQEADGSRSKKEFVSIMGIVKKEAKETKYWLMLIRAINGKTLSQEIDLLETEAEELIKIFSKIIINSSSH